MVSAHLQSMLEAWHTTIAPHQTLGIKAVPVPLQGMMRDIRGEFETAGFSDKFTDWMESEASKISTDSTWLAGHASDFDIKWWTSELTAAYVRGRNEVRKLYAKAMGHLLVAYFDTLWHPQVNETLVASGSLSELSRAFETAQVLGAIIQSDRSAGLWWALGQTHHDYINRRRDGSLGTGTYVGDPIFYTALAFAVVPGTASKDAEGNGEVEPIEAWQSEDVQHFWYTVARLMGYDGPRWWKFETARDLYHGQMTRISQIKPKQISEGMLAYPPSNRIKQF